MANRPDLRDITHNIGDALADCDREELLSMLTFLFREYVVDGPPPMLLHQTEALEDLAGLSFADLIVALQARLDHPELALFSVDGGRVSVKLQGVAHPLVAQSRSPDPVAPPPTEVRAEPAQMPAASPQSQPSRGAVDEARARGRGDLVGEGRAPIAAEMPRAEAPRPSGGLSVRGAAAFGGGVAGAASGRGASPAGSEAGAQPATAQPSAQPVAQPPSASPSPDKTPGDDDESSTRFSLLELD